MSFKAVGAFAVAMLSLAACHDNISAAAADDAQVCYRFPSGAPPKKALISPQDDNLETCAMHLEGYRLMHRQAVANGLYQGHYVYASAREITSAAAPGDIRYRVYTHDQQADLDAKIAILIAQDASATTGANTTQAANTQP